MGLLGDYLPDWLPDDPNQKAAARAGLLNFGAALMGGRGNLGQILGGGLMSGSQGYAGSLAAQQAQALQQAQIGHYGLESQVLQSKIDEPMNMARIINGGPAPVTSPSLLPSLPGRQPSAVSALASGMPMARPTSAPVQPSPQAPSIDGALDGSPDSAPAAIPDAQNTPDVPPSALPVSSLPQVGQIAPASASPTLFANYMAIGDRLTNAGKPAAAKQYYELAEKMRPKLKEMRALTTPDGKRVMANVYEDGTTSQLQGFGPDAEKLAFASSGGTYDGRDPFTGKVVSSTPMTATPGELLSNKTQIRGQDLTHADNTAGDQAPITDAAILNAAARYNLDGTLPPMGMGRNAAAGRSAILNKAAEMASGIDPSQQRRDQLSFKGDTASQNAAVKAFTSGKQGNSVRSFNVSLSHLDTLSSLADALHNRDAKLVNKFGNYIAEQTGNPAPTNFDAAKKIVGDEVVKAIVGAGGGVHDREEAARVIASANSPAQLKGAIGTYKELMRGQLDGLQQQYEASTGRKDFNKFLSQHAQDTRGPNSGGQPKVLAHPPEINSLLNKYGAHQ